MCVRAGSHAHAVVQLRSIERRSLRRVAGGHLHGRDELSGPGGGSRTNPPSALLTCLPEAAVGFVEKHLLICIFYNYILQPEAHSELCSRPHGEVMLLSPVCLQKYLQQLWDTVLLVALILSTGVIVHARWQYQDHQLNDNLEVGLWCCFTCAQTHLYFFSLSIDQCAVGLET